MTKETVKQLNDIYSDTYNQLYESDSPATEIIIDYFAMYHDNDMKKDPEYKKAVCELANYRQDLFSSDRECAAVYIAISAYERLKRFKNIATA